MWKKSQPLTVEASGGEAIPGYRDLKRVGRGGFSVVYRAHQEGLDRVVALKVLSVEFIDTQVRKRFLREVQLTSRLTGHPNVVTVLDSGMTASGRPYIAMEYFERGSLRDRLAAEGPLPLPEVLRIGVKVAGALGAAHQEGILHRDVKPQNILVSRYGEPALADFGTARLTAALDVSSRTEALTPFHSAPEILQGETPSPACDVYSLGSTLYHLLTGRPPYQSEDGGIAALLLRVLREDPPPIVRSGVPAQVTDMLRNAMAKAPADRYPDAWAFAYAMQRLQLELGLPLTELTNAPSLPADQRPVALPPPPAGRPAGESPAEPAQPAQPPVSRREPPRPIDIEIPDDPPGGTREYPTSDQTKVPQSIRLPDRNEPVPPMESPDERPSRRRWPIAVGVAVLAVAAVVAPAIFAGRTHSTASAPASTPPAAASWSAVSGAPAAAVSVNPDAMKPTGLTYTDGGASVALHWTLAPGSEAYNLWVDVSPRDAGRPAMVLPPGRTSYTVAGLNPALGYCFRVGPILSIGTGSQNGTVALSDPVCIRGAMVSTP